LEKVLENKEVHLNGIIDAYNKILAFYESIYNEPPIPGKIGDEIDSWGNEEILRKYAGYVIDGSSKYKIYVRRIDDSSEKRLPESMLRQRN
jgi:hypothetical protein